MGRKRNILMPVRFTKEEHAAFKHDCEMFDIKGAPLMRKAAMEYLRQLKRAQGMR